MASVFVSIIGTLTVMPLIGFSINLFTLPVSVPVINAMVDDTIVVVEAA